MMVSRSSLIWRVDSGQTRSSTSAADMALVVEARHGVVGLRLELGAGDAAGGIGLEERQPAAMDQIVDQRGDEDGLAGAGEAGDAEPDRRRDEACGAVGEVGERQAGLVGDRR